MLMLHLEEDLEGNETAAGEGMMAISPAASLN
jgi:hypothetical protein